MTRIIDICLDLPAPAGMTRPSLLEALLTERAGFERDLAADPGGPYAGSLRRAIERANVEIARELQKPNS